ncbi:hypothetical protein B0H14DRAFT_2596470 [Mycena olivaceomarginata]|nr:hypothetical protein B0H14DRAFT_2596470 [Mycena olivaceomarginata]
MRYLKHKLHSIQQFPVVYTQFWRKPLELRGWNRYHGPVYSAGDWRIMSRLLHMEMKHAFTVLQQSTCATATNNVRQCPPVATGGQRRPPANFLPPGILLAPWAAEGSECSESTPQCIAEDNNPFLGFFTGMMNQFMRDSMANGSFPASLAENTPPAASSPAARLPTLPVPHALPYTSARLQPISLPAAPTGHPLLSNNLSSYNTIQPMLGMGGLGIPVSGHSNNPRRRRRRVEDLSPTQISQTNPIRRAAAREHLAVVFVAPAVRGAVLNEAPGTTLEQVSSVDAAGVRQVKMTAVVQAFQPGQEVTSYKNYASVFGQFARDSHLLLEYTVAETTKMFGSLPAGPSMRLQHEQLHLQALAFVNCGKLRGAGYANLRRAPEVNATVTVQELFYPPWKNLFAVPTLCIQNGRFILNCIIRYNGASFLEESPNRSLSLRHHCLTACQNRQFTEAIEMNFHDSNSDDNASDTSGGVPTDTEDDDMPVAPTLAAATVPSTSRAAHTTLACADKDSTGRTHTYAFVSPNYFLAPSRPVSMDSQEDVKSSKAGIVAARTGVFSAIFCFAVPLWCTEIRSSRPNKANFTVRK